MNQNNQQHVKSYNPKSKGRNRLKFSSSKQKAKKLTADVYRSYKRKTGVLGPASREERVHHPENFRDERGSIGTVGLTDSGRKKRKLSNVVKTTSIDRSSTENASGFDGTSRTAIVRFDKHQKQQNTLASNKMNDDNDDDNDNNDKLLMNDDHEHEFEFELDMNTKTTFAMELDLARSRNGSQLFSKLYRQLAPLVKSLPEILHHAPKIVNILLSYVLSPRSNTNIPSSEQSWNKQQQQQQHDTSTGIHKKRQIFVVNLVTTDVLHLLAVLARDLRQEIHPFVHDLILPRIIHDLINPPTILDANQNDYTGDENNHDHDGDHDEHNENIEHNENDDDSDNAQEQNMDIDDEDEEISRIQSKSKIKPKFQQRTLDVAAIEAAFRTISYIFRYDSQEIVNETSTSTSTKDSNKKDEGHKNTSEDGCLELMRKHYGATLAHKQDFVRRLAAETFAPMIRKLKSNNARKKHIRRVIKSFASSAVVSVQREMEGLKREGKEDASTFSFDDAISPRLIRARDDAIDGVAMLLFYVVRGVSGRLHSKANAVLKIVINCLTMIDQKGSGNVGDRKKINQLKQQLESYKSYMIYRVVSKFIYNIRGHVSCADSFTSVWDELYSCANQIFRNKTQGEKTPVKNSGFTHIVQMVNESVSHGHGRLLRSQNGIVNDENAQKLADFLPMILKEDTYGQATPNDQRLILDTLCAAWKVFPDHPCFTTRLPYYIKLVSSKSCHSQSDDNDDSGSNSSVDPVLIISSELLPYVARELAAKDILPALLSSAVKRFKDEKHLSTIRLLHTVATCHLKVDVSDIEQCRNLCDNDNLFFIEESESCKISANDKQQLIDFCLNIQSFQTKDDKMSMQRKCTLMGLVIRILPFLTLLSCEDLKEEEDTILSINKVCTWIMSELKEMGICYKEGCNDPDKSNLIVVRSLFLQALACIASSQKEQPGVKNFIKKSKNVANDLLFDAPHSQLVLKGVSCIAQLLHNFGEELNEDQNEIYETLNGNLSSSSHFLRLHTLTLLNTFQRLPYVVNHDDLDLSGDLDEDVNTNRTKPKNANVTSIGLSGKCDLIETLLQIEATEINLQSERILASKISRVEILGRTGQLPVFYAEAASYHMFGLMHMKYQPLWNSAIRAIVALASCNEIAVWTSIEKQLRLVMKQSFFNEVVSTSKDENSKELKCHQDHLDAHFETLLKWDLSLGNDARLFQDQIFASQQNGRVSKHQNTDKITVFENVWKVIEGVPSLLANKSRLIIPMFLRFLHFQYYLFHDNDPDAREFSLESHINTKVDKSTM